MRSENALAGVLRLRRWLFWAHLTSGALASLLILFFAITGSLLAYERQMLAHADDTYIVHAGPSRLPIAELLHRAPFTVTAITILARPDAPIEMTAGKRDLYMVNPYTGEILGLASPRLRRFFATVTSLHRWFGLEDSHRVAASAVKAATNSIFLFLLLSGSVLWLPKSLSRSALRIRSRFTRRTSSRARAWNWHHVAGLWTGLPLLIIVVTGTVMAYPWANAMLFRIAGTPLPRRSSPEPVSRKRPGGPGNSMTTRDETPKVNFDGAFIAVAREHPGWRSITLRLQPGSSENGLAFTVDEGDGGHPAARTLVSASWSQDSRFILQQTPFRLQPRGQRWRAWVRFTHTGEAAGWLGETVALLSALGACVLAITGLQMFCQRVTTGLRRIKRVANGRA